jgi:hypothetical protein
VLLETPNVRQEPAGGRRRWFEDDVLPLELIVWYGAAEEIEGWQVCYDFGGGEHALNWRPGSGIVHRAVDTGSSGPLSNPDPDPGGRWPGPLVGNRPAVWRVQRLA